MLDNSRECGNDPAWDRWWGQRSSEKPPPYPPEAKEIIFKGALSKTTKRQCQFYSRTMLPRVRIRPSSSFTHHIRIELNSVQGRVLGAKVSVSVQMRIVPWGACRLGTQLPLKTAPACPACVLEQGPPSWRCVISCPHVMCARSACQRLGTTSKCRREPAVCRH